MTPETFFENFAYIAEAPNGVKKLRELILQMAVRGTLVPQDSSDEPAVKLLERIRAEKARLVKEKKIRKSDPLPLVTADEAPYGLPKGWEWVRFGTIAQHNSGKTLDKGRNSGHYRDYITTSNLYWGCFKLANVRQMLIREEELENCTATKGDLLICEGGEAGRAAVWNYDHDVCFQNHIHRARLFCNIVPYYVYRLFEKLNATGEIARYRKGVAISNMSSKALASIIVPLPPLAEQQRIVAKVDQLMTLCDDFEAKQQRTRAKLSLLNNSALDRLTSVCAADDFNAAWHLLRDNFDLLYTTPETIAKLRQSILQLAVQGKLVEQDPNDEPASVLLAKIKAEKERLVKAKKIRKSDPLPTVTDDEAPYGLPKGWEWVRLGDLREVVEYGTSQKAHDIPRGVPILRMNNINGGAVILANLKYVDNNIGELPKLYLQENDLLFNRTNSYELVGKTGIFRGESNKYTFASYLIRVRLMVQANPHYVNLVMNSPLFRATQIEPEITQQCGQANFNGTKLVNCLIPLPSFPEQHRIVTKVDQLMTLCDSLEARLTKAQAKAEKLTAATVQGLLTA
jgi:type I restriction enzyme S subunit